MNPATLDWDIAEDHLDQVEAEYKALGLPGIFGLAVIGKIRAQFEEGDRSKEMWDRIMEIQ